MALALSPTIGSVQGDFLEISAQRGFSENLHAARPKHFVCGYLGLEWPLPAPTEPKASSVPRANGCGGFWSALSCPNLGLVAHSPESHCRDIMAELAVRWVTRSGHAWPS